MPWVQWYIDFMDSERGGKLNPNDMRRKQRDMSLSGGYRKILARISGGWEVQVREYGHGVDGGGRAVRRDRSGDGEEGDVGMPARWRSSEGSRILVRGTARDTPKPVLMRR